MDNGKIEDLIQKIYNYSDDQNNLYIDKYNKNWIISVIEEDDIIKLLEKKIKEFDSKKGVDIVDFIKIFLTTVEHTESETLYICVALIDLFKDICDAYDLTNTIKGQDLVNYVVESFLQKNTNIHNVVTKKVPDKRIFDKDGKDYKIREIDLNAPTVLGDTNLHIKRLVRSKIITDSSHHNNNSIKRAEFADEIKKIFTLDSLADNISIYSINCQLEKKIAPKSFKDRKDVMIVDFDWSNQQLRIGACLKDYMLIFWDSNDNFEFEKSFSTATICNEYQSNIWYIDFLNKWLTTDKTHSLNCWDLEQEIKTNTYTFPTIKKDIIDVVAMEIFKVLAIASMDNSIIIWDPYRLQILLKLDLSKGGLHSAVFSNTYQILITAGYENAINLWSIHPLYFDESLKGRLIGHQSMVTAIQVIEKTPMIISADDNGQIKIWDIRSLNCIQTVELGTRVVMTKLIDLYAYGKLCFVGSRVNFIDFDDSYNIQISLKSEEHLWPIRMEYNFLGNELIICTRKDMRFVDGNTGRTKRIYTGLLKNEEDDIVSYRILQQNKKFILCDHRGNMGLYNYMTGEHIKDLVCHSNEISSLRIDYTNKLIISSSWDSSVYIQKEENNEFKLKRSIVGVHYNKEIILMELSVYHNLFVTCTTNNIIYIWDYEYMKLLASIQIDNESEPTAIQFINGYGILIICCNHGRIHFFHFKRRDISYIWIHRLAVIDINASLSYSSSINNNIISMNSKHHGNNNSDNQQQQQSDEKDEQEFHRRKSIMLLDNKKKMKSHYNLFRDTTINSTLAANGNTNNGCSGKYHDKEANNNNNNNNITPTSHNYSGTYEQYENTKPLEYVSKILLDVYYPSDKAYENASNDSNTMIDDIQHESRLYVGLSKGMIQCYDITRLFQAENLEMVLHANSRTNYNAKRTVSDNFETLIKNLKIYNYDIKNPQEPSSGSSLVKMPTILMDLRGELLYKFQAHKDSLTSLSFMLCPDKKILTSSIDYHVKIWELKGTLICSMNINHPLPVMWNIQFNKQSSAKKRIIHAFAILDNVLKRYNKKLTVIEVNKINVNNFFQELEILKTPNNATTTVSGSNNTSSNKISNNNTAQKANIGIKIVAKTNEKPGGPLSVDNKKVLLMKDEYSPRDLQYETSKKIYQKELQGPTLKQMEVAKRLAIAQKIWKETQVKEEEKYHNRNKNIEEAINKNSTDIMAFMLGDMSSQPSQTSYQIHSPKIMDLAKKLETYNHSKDMQLNIDMKQTQGFRRTSIRRTQAFPKDTPSISKYLATLDKTCAEKGDLSHSSDDSGDDTKSNNGYMHITSKFKKKKSLKASQNQLSQMMITHQSINAKGGSSSSGGGGIGIGANNSSSCKSLPKKLNDSSKTYSTASKFQVRSSLMSASIIKTPKIENKSPPSKTQIGSIVHSSSAKAHDKKNLDFFDYAAKKLPQLDYLSNRPYSRPGNQKDSASMNLQYLLRTQHQDFQKILKNLEENQKKYRKEISTMNNMSNGDALSFRRTSDATHMKITTNTFYTSGMPGFHQHQHQHQNYITSKDNLDILVNNPNDIIMMNNTENTNNNSNSKQDQQSDQMRVSKILLDPSISDKITIKKYKQEIHDFFKKVEQQNKEFHDQEEGKLNAVQNKINKQLQNYKLKIYTDGESDAGYFEPLSNIFPGIVKRTHLDEHFLNNH